MFFLKKQKIKSYNYNPLILILILSMLFNATIYAISFYSATPLKKNADCRYQPVVVYSALKVKYQNAQKNHLCK